MHHQGVAVLVLLLSWEATGLGTEFNHFSFVDLDYSTSVSVYYSSVQTEPISPPITFGRNTYQYASISQNGYIHFNSYESRRPSSYFNYYSNNNFIIAPYWDNLYFGSSGYVKYELYTSDYSYKSQQLRDHVTNYIFDVLGEATTVDTLLVVEWHGMVSRDDAAYADQNTATNSFQALVTSSTTGRSYAIFTYKCGELEWSDYPTIGYNAQDGLYRNHPYSLNRTSPNPIACVNYPNSDYSNVVYRIDSTAEQCSSFQFGCSSGGCVSKSYKCDGYPDCLDGTDEVACSPVPCLSSLFSCWSGGCVSLSKECDGTRDCSDGSDEMSCSQISTGSIIGIVSAGLIVTLVFCVFIFVSISYQIKQRNRRRIQFQRLRSELSVQPQTTPSTQTRYFHPKPGEWYQTIEGHWVQGPPPVYSPGEEQGNSFLDEGAVVFIGDSENTAASSPTPNAGVLVENTSLLTTNDPVPSPIVPNESSSSTEVEASPDSATLSEVCDEGNSLEARSSGSSIEDSENSPLIES